MSIVTSNVPPDTTSGALAVTDVPMVTSSSNQSVGISSDPVLASNPSDMSRTLVSLTAPVVSKLIVAICPDPRTSSTPGRLNRTRIVSASTNSHESIGTVVPLMFPSQTAVAFTTFGSNERSNCPESRSTTL